MVVYTAASITISILLFIAAGVCEIGGGWLVWQWRKEGWHWGFFILGSLILVGYGIIPTFQDQGFGRIYAAYGGAFIAMSLLWGWAFDGTRPDKWDGIGAAIAIVGVVVILFVPRHDGGSEAQSSTVSPSPSPSPPPSGIHV